MSGVLCGSCDTNNFFFCQAEDGIRDYKVTGVQTCALPISFYTVLSEGDDQQDPIADAARAILDGHVVLSRALAESGHYRSEERRVGKECRSRWSPYH